MQRSVALHLTRAVNAFQMLLMALNGVIANFTDSKNLVYLKLKTEALNSINNLLNNFIDGEIVNLVSSVTEEAAKQYAIDTYSTLTQNTILLAHQANVETLYQLRKALKAQALTIRNEIDGIMRRKVTEKILNKKPMIGEKITGNVRDSVGRYWKGTVYFQTLIRKAIIDAYVNAYAAISSEQGYDVVKVAYDDHTHRNDGLMISLKGKTNYQTLDSMRKELFHPNTMATVKVVI